MKITLTLTEDHIKLIQNFRFRQFGEGQYGIDAYDLLGGTYPQEDIAYIIGVYDQVVPGSMESPLGPVFNEEAQSRIFDLMADLNEHLEHYETMVHQFADTGLRVGRYECNDSNMIWKYLGK